MLDYAVISKYELLNEFTTKMSFKRICASVHGFYLDATWLVCDIYGKKLFDWDFQKRRQLFLELVKYYLEAGKIKFGKKVSFA